MFFVEQGMLGVVMMGKKGSGQKEGNFHKSRRKPCKVYTVWKLKCWY